jgi:hypothetical protein
MPNPEKTPRPALAEFATDTIASTAATLGSKTHMSSGDLMVTHFLLWNWIICSLTGLGVNAGQDDEDFEALIEQYSPTTPLVLLNAAKIRLEEAGIRAFPALLAHVTDNAPANEAFQEALVRRRADGTFKIVDPTIGDACFGLLQRQIEGAWPKVCRNYHALSPRNIRGWVEYHRGLSLEELRVQAAQQSLDRAFADAIAGRKHHRATLPFLAENLTRAKKERPREPGPGLKRSTQ